MHEPVESVERAAELVGKIHVRDVVPTARCDGQLAGHVERIGQITAKILVDRIDVHRHRIAVRQRPRGILRRIHVQIRGQNHQLRIQQTDLGARVVARRGIVERRSGGEVIGMADDRRAVRHLQRGTAAPGVQELEIILAEIASPSAGDVGQRLTGCIGEGSSRPAGTARRVA